MFVRPKNRGKRTYLLVVENVWSKTLGKVEQRTLHSLGRLDVLLAVGRLDGLIASAGRFSEKLAVLGARERGESLTARIQPIGAAPGHHLSYPSVCVTSLPDYAWRSFLWQGVFARRTVATASASVQKAV